MVKQFAKNEVTLVDVPLGSTKDIGHTMKVFLISIDDIVGQGIVSESLDGKGLWRQQALTIALMAIEN